MSKQQSHHLTHIGFQQMLPSPALRPFIRSFWAILSSGQLNTKQHEFMHSYGSLGLIFNWGDTLELNNGHYSQSVNLDGVSPYSRQITLAGNVQAFGILFEPAGAFPFFGVPMSETVHIDCLQSFNLPQLHEQLSRLPTLQKKVTRVESQFSQLLTSGHDLSPVIPHALKQISRSQGKQSIQLLANEIDSSERQLERAFRKEVGLTPKQYARIIRLHRARFALKKPTRSSLTDIAHETGFYDQAHFNHEFKKVIGITPGVYISRQAERQTGKN